MGSRYSAHKYLRFISKCQRKREFAVMFDMVAFDADDTLWHNESVFQATERQFAGLLAAYHPPEWVRERLFSTEMRNLRHFGYGAKGFTLSMIETAVDLTEGTSRGDEI